MSGEGRRYQANGFVPITEPPARIHRPADTDTIVKGDVLHDDGNGYATNATTAFAATFLGVAAADCDNAGGSAGDKNVEIYPLDFNTRYIVPVANNAVITQTIVGTYVDLENNDDIDISDNVTEGIAFFVEEIDAGTLAVAANTYGYAIGCFRVVGTQA